MPPYGSQVPLDGPVLQPGPNGDPRTGYLAERAPPAQRRSRTTHGDCAKGWKPRRRSDVCPWRLPKPAGKPPRRCLPLQISPFAPPVAVRTRTPEPCQMWSIRNPPRGPGLRPRRAALGAHASDEPTPRLIRSRSSAPVRGRHRDRTLPCRSAMRRKARRMSRPRPMVLGGYRVHPSTLRRLPSDVGLRRKRPATQRCPRSGDGSPEYRSAPRRKSQCDAKRWSSPSRSKTRVPRRAGAAGPIARSMPQQPTPPLAESAKHRQSVTRPSHARSGSTRPPAPICASIPRWRGN